MAKVGGQPAALVTKRTNVLVTRCFQAAGKLRQGEVLSAKARRAAALRAAGQAIEVMDEADFVQRLAL